MAQYLGTLACSLGDHTQSQRVQGTNRHIHIARHCRPQTIPQTLLQLVRRTGIEGKNQNLSRLALAAGQGVGNLADNGRGLA